MNKQIEIHPDLDRQISEVSEIVHDLLDGPDGDGELTGKMERQRVVLEVPRAFVVLATFMAGFEPKKMCQTIAGSTSAKKVWTTLMRDCLCAIIWSGFYTTPCTKNCIGWRHIGLSANRAGFRRNCRR